MSDYKDMIVALRTASERNSNSLNTRDACRKAADAIEQLVKERDAEPARHGHWTERYDEDGNPFFRRKFYCSECGDWQTYGKTDYCPACGAKMDETKGENDV